MSNEQNDPTVRKTVALPESVWRLIDDFRFENRFKRENEALQRLVRPGAEAAKQASGEKR